MRYALCVIDPPPLGIPNCTVQLIPPPLTTVGAETLNFAGIYATLDSLSRNVPGTSLTGGIHQNIAHLFAAREDEGW